VSMGQSETWDALSSGEGRIIVCGGRTYRDSGRVYMVLEEYAQHDPVIVTGGARGADRLASQAACELGLRHEEHIANWERYGKAAGPRRNEEMAEEGAALCIAFAGGNGTRDMVRRAKAHGIQIREER